MRKPATALITDGPYRFSRNPTYLSLTLLYVGVGVLLDSVWTLILVVLLLVLMDRWIIHREERHLEARFGEQYLRYKSAVRPGCEHPRLPPRRLTSAGGDGSADTAGNDSLSEISPALRDGREGAHSFSVRASSSMKCLRTKVWLSSS